MTSICNYGTGWTTRVRFLTGQDFLSATMFRLTLGPTLPPIHGHQGYFLWVKWLEVRLRMTAIHSLPHTSAWHSTSLSRDIFTFHFGS
jgi:hypothetical protein